MVFHSILLRRRCTSECTENTKDSGIRTMGFGSHGFLIQGRPLEGQKEDLRGRSQTRVITELLISLNNLRIYLHLMGLMVDSTYRFCSVEAGSSRH